MSNGDGDARGSVDPTEKTHARAPHSLEPEHTDVHYRASRTMELLQDTVVILLAVTLLGLAFAFLWEVWRELVGAQDLQRAISDIIYVVITVELYRLLVHYLRYHRVNLNILVEVGVSAIIQKMILVGIDRFAMGQLIGISLVLVALGLLPWMNTRDRRHGTTLTPVDARVVADPEPTALEDREDRHVVDSPRDRKPTG